VIGPVIVAVHLNVNPTLIVIRPVDLPWGGVVPGHVHGHDHVGDHDHAHVHDREPAPDL